MNFATFFGPPNDCPDTSIIEKIGSLIEVDSSAKQIIFFVPANAIVKDMELELPDEGCHFSVFIGEGADVNGSISLLASDSASYHVEVFCGSNASASVSLLQVHSAKKVTVVQKNAVSTDAKLRWMNVSLGAAETLHSYDSELMGPGAESFLDWIFYAKHKEKSTLSATNKFVSPHGQGEMTLRGIAEHQSTVDCRGMIAIGPKGNATQAYLTEEVLMLDPTAKVDAIPGLEIKTNDVKASHSATVSRLTEADLFYFAARGVEESLARKMYIEGYLSDVTEKMTEPVALQVQEAIDAKYLS